MRWVLISSLFLHKPPCKHHEPPYKMLIGVGQVSLVVGVSIIVPSASNTLAFHIHPVNNCSQWW